uniref:Leukocyte cell-derived chemotaxin 1 n=1 Tax=Oryzias latipes TaxID=8090 RepID=A0A3P9L9E8_ORYLA
MDTEKEMDKVKNATDAFCRSLGQRTSCKATISNMLGCGAVLLFFGAVLFLCACVTTPHLWKLRDKNVYNVRYSLNINGEVREGSMEIDSDNNLERFKTGSGAEEAVEIHDFQIGITGIRFFGGDKCYIKSQIKANLPLLGAHNKEALMFDLTDELLPATFGEDSLVWVPAEQPLKDTTFLSNKILDLCGEFPIFWLQPIVFKDGERKKPGVRRAKRQLNMEEMKAAAEARDPVSRTEHDASESPDRGESGAGSAYNPENPYHRSGGARDESAVTFDTMLEHQGICCSECRRSYTQCQRVCHPLRGYWPWPYHHRGCQVACRVIMPCRWWVARILGVV